MNKPIFLFWYKKNDDFNFGDDLNPYIVHKLSNRDVQPVMVLRKKGYFILDILRLLRGIVEGYYKWTIFTEYFRGIFHPNYVVGIGSILHNNFSKKARIWGAGIINRHVDINHSNFIAVRGYETVARLKVLGYDFNGSIGDPGLLLPLVYNPDVPQNEPIGLIPHVYHFEDMKQWVKDRDGYTLVNLNDKNIEKTIRSIKSCKYILSSSLHGIITAHAYGIPALQIQFGTKLKGDGVKFFDYFSSVGIKYYSAIKFPIADDYDMGNLSDLFEEYKDKSLPSKETINSIQLNLLSCAPFPLADQFKTLC